MPLPRSLARANRVGLNRVVVRVAGYLPGFAVVHHRGRRSGRTYRTPVNAFRIGNGYRFALTYGTDSDWARNVLAAGECDITVRGRVVHLDEPRLEVDRGARWAPAPVALVLRRIGADSYLQGRVTER
ncbi:nitroreductase family deazaflavin-dependent oxidoreductase [Rhodococcus sp. TAF43]|uniref:nitroreductase family deazaflavin-dependent oxidoreductase n=1 Tax=unclassified Rhodococcus (in: high G+C Gram-positive bacteria) TaxID=192944 RepID=UPI001582D143|nr:nitroreductase family deazaflavin-dependent oxidoreductase [Rhodococcus sp. W8901]QKT11549.1 nitroreductase family deazaflavin-dependent oxidoreductase [Rhodococcus sp. W8901]